MTTPDVFDLVYDFNDKAGLIKAGYSDSRESAFQIEEALEGFNIAELSRNITDYRYSTDSAKELARYILTDECFIGTDVDRLDKACDAIIFAVGSMAKLGLSPEQMRQALDIVVKANLAKLSMPKDEYGKLTKPTDWEQYAPEKELQLILDKRKPSGQ